MLFLHVESAHQRSAELRRAADHGRRHRAPGVVHQVRALDLERARPKRARRWGATVASVTRLAR